MDRSSYQISALTSHAHLITLPLPNGLSHSLFKRRTTTSRTFARLPSVRFNIQASMAPITLLTVRRIRLRLKIIWRARTIQCRKARETCTDTGKAASCLMSSISSQPTVKASSEQSPSLRRLAWLRGTTLIHRSSVIVGRLSKILSKNFLLKT